MRFPSLKLRKRAPASRRVPVVDDPDKRRGRNDLAESAFQGRVLFSSIERRLRRDSSMRTGNLSFLALTARVKFTSRTRSPRSR